MKNDLTCAVVRDLLPLFVEGLTSDETNRAVDAHLSGCPDCAARRDAMTAPAEPAEQEETAREVDYLKKVKRRNGKWVVLAVVCTVLILFAGYTAKVFFIGTEASYDDVTILSAQTTAGHVLRLTVAPISSDTACYGWEVSTANNQTNLHARRVAASPLHPSEATQVEIPLDDASIIYLCGRLAWQDGIYITSSTWELYDAQTNYVGDAVAVGNLLTKLDRWYGPLGYDYTISLQTSSAPYGLTIRQTDPQYLWPSMTEKVQFYSVQLLALVENLDMVTWEYTDENGQIQSWTITLADAQDLLQERAQASGQTAYLKDSIKDYALSVLAFQKMCSLWQNP